MYNVSQCKRATEANHNPSKKTRARRSTLLKSHGKRGADQGCQIFLGPNIPKRETYTKWPQTIPNGRKIFRMVTKYIDIFHSKALQILPKIGILV
jgi:hypothetical protein